VGFIFGVATGCVMSLLCLAMSALWAIKAGDGVWRGYPLMEALGR
jgi:hypothetical protein